jgi:transposase
MNQHILGVDISKDTFDVVLRGGSSKEYQVFTNNDPGFAHLQRWLISRKAGQVHACMEATGQYGDRLAEYLYKQGHEVSIVNPARIKRYGDSKLHRNKTDKADADLIAEFCYKEAPALWAPPPAYLKQLRQFVRRLDDLQTNYQQEANRLHAGIEQEDVIADIQDHLLYLQERIRTLERSIQELIAATPELKDPSDLLVTIPGIGKLTAARLIAEIGDIMTFDNAPQLAAYAGLNPKGARSGTSVYKKTRISKEGRSFLRYILYMPAIVARKYNPIIREFCDRLEKRHLPQMAIIAAAMRKLLHLVFGVLKHNTPFDPCYLADPVLTS